VKGQLPRTAYGAEGREEGVEVAGFRVHRMHGGAGLTNEVRHVVSDGHLLVGLKDGTGLHGACGLRRTGARASVR
jgi:hypothetical protein